MKKVISSILLITFLFGQTAFASGRKITLAKAASLGALALASVAVLGGFLAARRTVNSFLFPDTNKQDYYNPNEIKKTKILKTEKNSSKIEIKRQYLEIGKLKGATYEALNPSSNSLAGKCVIFFGPNQNSVTDWVGNNGCCKLLEKGAKILALDYEGYGYSKSRLACLKICEKSIYKDGEIIYDYAKNAGYKSKDIIAFGFSLGGAVASHIAAYAEKTGEGLRGLILASPINNLDYTGRIVTGSALLTKIGKFVSQSQLDTEKNLSKIKNKALPIFICSGSEDEDYLSIKKTKIDEKLAQAGFSAVSSHASNCCHTDINAMFDCKKYLSYIEKL